MEKLQSQGVHRARQVPPVQHALQVELVQPQAAAAVVYRVQLANSDSNRAAPTCSVWIVQQDMSNLDLEPLLAKHVKLVNMLYRKEAERVQNVNLVGMRILCTVNRVKSAVLANTKIILP